MAHSFFNDSFTLESVQDAQDEPLGDVQMEVRRFYLFHRTRLAEERDAC